MHTKNRNIAQFIWLIIGVLCIVYGIYVSSVASGSDFYMFWYFLGAFFVFVAIGSHFHILKNKSKVIKRIIYIIVAVLLAGLAFLEGLIISGFKDTTEENLDYIIVLGAQIKDDGPSIILKYRLDKAIDYLNNNPETICVVTGGIGFNENRPEADGMAEYLIENGIDKDRIVLENKSKTTDENIGNTMKLVDLDGKKIGIVTNNFHMFRALKIAKEQGISDAYGIVAGSTPSFLPNNMLREAISICKNVALGNMWIF